MNIKEQVKIKAKKVKNWVSDHKGAIAAGAVCTLCGAVWLKHAMQKSSVEAIPECESDEPIDYGRDMKMQFVYEDTGELMEGDVRCTELYAKEMIEMADE